MIMSAGDDVNVVVGSQLYSIFLKHWLQLATNSILCRRGCCHNVMIFKLSVCLWIVTTPKKNINIE